MSRPYRSLELYESIILLVKNLAYCGIVLVSDLIHVVMMIEGKGLRESTGSGEGTINSNMGKTCGYDDLVVDLVKPFTFPLLFFLPRLIISFRFSF